MGKRLKIFFHDNCFDGAASAALFADFYRQRVDAGASVVLQGVQHQQGDPFAGLSIDGDDNACVDFRFSPKMSWWFDHHVSAFQPPTLRAQYEANTSGTVFYDPAARSNTKFQCQTLIERFGYEVPLAFSEVVRWADIIDSANFESPTVAVTLGEPSMLLMTWLEANEDPNLTHRFIESLGRVRLAELATQSWITGPLVPLLERHRSNIELIRQRAIYDEGVVYFDLGDDGVASFNKFISYYLHPDASYTIGVTSAADRVKISVGSNPWAPEKRRHDIASICERYGGGGHPVVGAVTMPSGELADARRIASEIREELSATPPVGG